MELDQYTVNFTWTAHLREVLSPTPTIAHIMYPWRQDMCSSYQISGTAVQAKEITPCQVEEIL